MKVVSGSRTIKAVLFGLLLLLAFFLSPQARAQPPPQQGGDGQGIDRQNDRRGGLIRALNLSPEQVNRIKAIQEQNKQERRAVAIRLRLAQRALDEAIYSDATSEALVEERARELASAQAAAVRLRAQTELSIRRVLTPDQLTAFRNLRQQARLAERDRRLQSQQNRRTENNFDEPLPRDRLLRRRNAPPLRKDGGIEPAHAPRERRGALLRGRRQ